MAACGSPLDGAFARHRLRLAVALPVAAGVADFVENLLVQRAVAIFPQPLAFRGWLWSFAHRLKWLSVGAAVLGCLMALRTRLTGARVDPA